MEHQVLGRDTRPKLAGELLSPALIGVILAGVFASTISTADSQVLACSAVVTQDLKTYEPIGSSEVVEPSSDGLERAYRLQKIATTLVILGVITSALKPI